MDTDEVNNGSVILRLAIFKVRQASTTLNL